MTRLCRVALVALSFLVLGNVSACQPCDDPSQLICPDQW